MTNINCSSNCIYQKDGKCCLDNTVSQTFNNNHDCAYFCATNKNVQQINMNNIK